MKREEIEGELKKIHETFSHVAIDHDDVEILHDDEIWIHFSDGPPMTACEFYFGSRTRNLLLDWVESELDNGDF